MCLLFSWRSMFFFFNYCACSFSSKIYSCQPNERITSSARKYCSATSMLFATENIRHKQTDSVSRTFLK